MAKRTSSILAILGVAVPIITSTLVYAKMMGRQTEAIEQLGTQFTSFKSEVSTKVDNVQTTLSAIETEVRHNTEMNKEQIDVYRAETIAHKVVNDALRRAANAEQ